MPFGELPQLQDIVMRIPGVLMGFTFHEFGHAWAATMLGDDTPRLQGRLTLSPRAHLDPLGTILLFLGGFGWAKPVMVDVNKLRPRIWGDVAVSLAGVAMNFLLAVVFYALFVLSRNGLLFEYRNPVLDGTLIQVVEMNVILIGFNLIPLPPLDGFRVARYLLPSSADGLVYNLYRFGPWVLILLFATPFTEYVMVPVYGGIMDAVHSLVFPLLKAVYGLFA